MLTESELKAIVSEVLIRLGYNDHPSAWSHPEALAAMVAATPARIGIGRAGARCTTAAWLKFRMDHAMAREAISHEIDRRFLDELGAVVLQSRAADRRQYLARPDLGRQLSAESEALAQAQCRPGARVQIVVIEGLSGAAVEANALEFLRAFTDGMAGIVGGPPIFVRLGRVAVMDQIGALLRPELVVELAGERPGLVTAESMSAYFCFRPGLQTIESDRNLIANIHKGGIPPAAAGAQAAMLAARILAAGASGVKLGL